MRARLAALLFLFLAPFLPAQSLPDFEKKVTEFTLPNGLHFIVLERHDAPVVSFHTLVNAGSVDDPGGKTGLAHMFEHMAFKGTRSIGTKNWAAEQKAMAAIEGVYVIRRPLGDLMPSAVQNVWLHFRRPGYIL